MTIPRPGEIYWAFVEGGRRHPYVIVSRDELNRGGYVIAAQLTSSKLTNRRGLRNCVPLRAGQFGLPKDCVVQSEMITFMDKDDFDWESGRIGTLDGSSMRDVIRSIGYVIAAECEPT